MRIGNGPRLVVPRPGTPGRRGWGWRYLDRGQAYDEWRALQRRKWLVMHRLVVAGDVKPQAVQLSSLKPGDHYRLVDAHGRTTAQLEALAKAWGEIKAMAPSTKG